jgi:hypothetical protein
MKIEVEKSDLLKIGIGKINQNGFLAVECDLSLNYRIEEIFLRNILKCGGDYHIVDEYADEESNVIVFLTDLPFEEAIYWR